MSEFGWGEREPEAISKWHGNGFYIWENDDAANPAGITEEEAVVATVGEPEAATGNIVPESEPVL